MNTEEQSGITIRRTSRARKVNSLFANDEYDDSIKRLVSRMTADTKFMEMINASSSPSGSAAKKPVRKRSISSEDSCDSKPGDSLLSPNSDSSISVEKLKEEKVSTEKEELDASKDVLVNITDLLSKTFSADGKTFEYSTKDDLVLISPSCSGISKVKATKPSKQKKIDSDDLESLPLKDYIKLKINKKQSESKFNKHNKSEVKNKSNDKKSSKSLIKIKMPGSRKLTASNSKSPLSCEANLTKEKGIEKIPKGKKVDSGKLLDVSKKFIINKKARSVELCKNISNNSEKIELPKLNKKDVDRKNIELANASEKFILNKNAKSVDTYKNSEKTKLHKFHKKVLIVEKSENTNSKKLERKSLELTDISCNLVSNKNGKSLEVVDASEKLILNKEVRSIEKFKSIPKDSEKTKLHKLHKKDPKKEKFENTKLDGKSIELTDVSPKLVNVNAKSLDLFKSISKDLSKTKLHKLHQKVFSEERLENKSTKTMDSCYSKEKCKEPGICKTVDKFEHSLHIDSCDKSNLSISHGKSVKESNPASPTILSSMKSNNHKKSAFHDKNSLVSKISQKETVAISTEKVCAGNVELPTVSKHSDEFYVCDAQLENHLKMMDDIYKPSKPFNDGTVEKDSICHTGTKNLLSPKHTFISDDASLKLPKSKSDISQYDQKEKNENTKYGNSKISNDPKTNIDKNIAPRYINIENKHNLKDPSDTGNALHKREVEYDLNFESGIVRKDEKIKEKMLRCKEFDKANERHDKKRSKREDKDYSKMKRKMNEKDYSENICSKAKLLKECKSETSDEESLKISNISEAVHSVLKREKEESDCSKESQTSKDDIRKHAQSEGLSINYSKTQKHETFTKSIDRNKERIKKDNSDIKFQLKDTSLRHREQKLQSKSQSTACKEEKEKINMQEKHKIRHSKDKCDSYEKEHIAEDKKFKENIILSTVERKDAKGKHSNATENITVKEAASCDSKSITEKDVKGKIVKIMECKSVSKGNDLSKDKFIKEVTSKEENANPKENKSDLVDKLAEVVMSEINDIEESLIVNKGKRKHELSTETSNLKFKSMRNCDDDDKVMPNLLNALGIEQNFKIANETSSLELLDTDNYNDENKVTHSLINSSSNEEDSLYMTKTDKLKDIKSANNKSDNILKVSDLSTSEIKTIADEMPCSLLEKSETIDLGDEENVKNQIISPECEKILSPPIKVDDDDLSNDIKLEIGHFAGEDVKQEMVTEGFADINTSCLEVQNIESRCGTEDSDISNKNRTEIKEHEHKYFAESSIKNDTGVFKTKENEDQLHSSLSETLSLVDPGSLENIGIISKNEKIDFLCNTLSNTVDNIDSGLIDVTNLEISSFKDESCLSIMDNLNRNDVKVSSSKIVEERLKSFTHIDENIYLNENRKSKRCKEVRRMICDCSLSKEEIENGEMGCGEDCLNRLLMIECGSRCPLKENCSNKKFQKKEYAKIEVFNAYEKGCGVRSIEDISPREPQKCFCATFICRGWLGEPPDEKTKEEKDEERKREEKERQRREERRAYLEDMDLEEELEKLIARRLRNRQDTLTLSRLMVRAEDLESRITLLSLLQSGENACRRLFLDYHGLKLLWSWMADLDSKPGHYVLKNEILSTLGCLPITNRTQLTDSKVMNVIEKWLASASKGRINLCNKSLPPSVSGQIKDSSGPKKLSDEDSDNEENRDIGNGGTEDSNSIDSVEISTKTSEEDSSDSNLSLTINAAEVSVPADEKENPDQNDDALKSVIEFSEKLLESWKNLKEEFRIPKKERVELMKAHEREAEAGYKQLLIQEMQEGKALDSRDDKKEISYNRWKKIPDTERLRKNKIDLEEKDDGSPKLSKEERRQLFEMQVAQEDEAKQKKIQENLWLLHLERCNILGQDPYYLPLFDPTGHFFWDSNSQNWQLYTGNPDISLPVPAQYLKNRDPSIMESPLYSIPVSPLPRLELLQNFQEISNIPLPGEATPLFQQKLTSVVNLESASPHYPILPENTLESQVSPPKAVTVCLPPKWRIARDSERNVYFYHVKKRISQWELPVADNPTQESDSDSDSDSSSSSSLDSDFSSDDEPEGDKESAEVTEQVVDVAGLPEKMIKSSRKRRRHSDALVQERVISPVPEIDRETARKERREAKERAREEARMEKINVIPINVLDNEILDESVLSKKEQAELIRSMKPIRVHSSKSKERASSAIADNTECARKIKESFRSKVATYIVSVLNPYRKSDCIKGKITSAEDFKYLARKLTHFVMVKELKQLPSVDVLEFSDSVKHKTKDFVKKYMNKYGSEFIRDPNDTKEY